MHKDYVNIGFAAVHTGADPSRIDRSDRGNSMSSSSLFRSSAAMFHTKSQPENCVPSVREISQNIKKFGGSWKQKQIVQFKEEREALSQFDANRTKFEQSASLSRFANIQEGQEYEGARQEHDLLRAVQSREREREHQEGHRRASQEMEELKRAHNWGMDEFSRQESRRVPFKPPFKPPLYLPLNQTLWEHLRVSGAHLPPTSTPMTTSLARARGPTNSGYVLDFRSAAAVKATPSSTAARHRGVPSQ